MSKSAVLLLLKTIYDDISISYWNSDRVYQGHSGHGDIVRKPAHLVM